MYMYRYVCERERARQEKKICVLAPRAASFSIHHTISMGKGSYHRATSRRHIRFFFHFKNL